MLGSACPPGPEYRTIVLLMSDNENRVWTEEEIAAAGILCSTFEMHRQSYLDNENGEHSGHPTSPGTHNGDLAP